MEPVPVATLFDPLILLTIGMIVYYSVHVKFARHLSSFSRKNGLRLLTELFLAIIPILYYAYTLNFKIEDKHPYPDPAVKVEKVASLSPPSGYNL